MAGYEPGISEWGNPGRVMPPCGKNSLSSRGNRANGNIPVARGKESKCDSPSSGERKGKSPNRYALFESDLEVRSEKLEVRRF